MVHSMLRAGALAAISVHFATSTYALPLPIAARHTDGYRSVGSAQQHSKRNVVIAGDVLPDNLLDGSSACVDVNCGDSLGIASLSAITVSEAPAAAPAPDVSAVRHHDNDTVVIVDGDHKTVRIPRSTLSMNATTSGTLALMMPEEGSADMTEIASLVIASSNDTPSPFVLDASAVNSTQFMMNVLDQSMLATMGAEQSPLPSAKVTVTLSTAHPDSVEGRVLCTTFDPAPTSPAQFTMEGCLTGPGSGSKSQLFLFDQETGQVSPMWQGQSDASAAAVDDAPNEDPEFGSKDASDGNDMPSMAAGVDPLTPLNNQIASVTDVGDDLAGSELAMSESPVTFSSTPDVAFSSPTPSAAASSTNAPAGAAPQSVIFVFKPSD